MPVCESKGCEQWERARRGARRRPDTWQGKFVANNSVLAQSTYFTPNLGGWEMVVLRVPATHTPSLLTVSLSLSHTTHTMCAAHTMRPSFEEEAVVFNLRAASHPRGMAPPGKGRFLLPLRGLGDWPLSSQLPAASATFAAERSVGVWAAKQGLPHDEAVLSAVTYPQSPPSPSPLPQSLSALSQDRECHERKLAPKVSLGASVQNQRGVLAELPRWKRTPKGFGVPRITND